MQEKTRITHLAHKSGLNHSQVNSKETRKALGQFMTPRDIAIYMAKRAIQTTNKDTLRILEPAAGSGILAAAIFDSIFKREQKPKKIKFVLYEVDAGMLSKLTSLANRMRAEAKSAGVKLSCSIRIKDFLLNLPQEQFDIIIANPPFFKLKSGDERAIAHKHVVHGQPNIYGLFMTACASLLSDSGCYCFLTPRSWTSGPYFSHVRKYLFRHLQLDAIHLFENRRATFKDDQIQQEMMITWASVRKALQEEVVLITSQGISDLNSSKFSLVPRCQIFVETINNSVTLPVLSQATIPDGWKDTLLSLGMQASTGKVVPFRATSWIVEKRAKNTVPLLWLQHIHRSSITWPLKRKGEHIKALIKSKKILIPNDNYVLVRRFSPRDSTHWVTAAAYVKTDIHHYIGIENHLNYIHKTNGSLLVSEAVGLSAYLNSRFVNRYLSARLGHTQINAADLNNLPVPSIAKIKRIGKAIATLTRQEKIDAVVEMILLEPENNSGSEIQGPHYDQTATKEPSL